MNSINVEISPDQLKDIYALVTQELPKASKEGKTLSITLAGVEIARARVQYERRKGKKLEGRILVHFADGRIIKQSEHGYSLVTGPRPSWVRIIDSKLA